MWILIMSTLCSLALHYSPPLLSHDTSLYSIYTTSVQEDQLISKVLVHISSFLNVSIQFSTYTLAVDIHSMVTKHLHISCGHTLHGYNASTHQLWTLSMVTKHLHSLVTKHPHISCGHILWLQSIYTLAVDTLHGYKASIH